MKKNNTLKQREDKVYSYNFNQADRAVKSSQSSKTVYWIAMQLHWNYSHKHRT